MTESKLQIRAKVLSAIVDLQKPANRNPQSITNILGTLAEISDKNTILETVLKELKTETTDDKQHILFFIISELLDKNKVEEAFLKELANPSVSDSIKANLINILRGLGNHLNYDDYLNYLKNPEEIIDADTTRLLSNAIVNPEAQIDFLDFINALPETEAGMLLESLNSDYDGDNLANILSPLILSKPRSELGLQAIKNIGASKSQLALSTLKNVIDNVDDLKVQAAAQKSINLLKLAGIKEENTDEFYKNILSSSPVFKCYTNLPDGQGNLGIIFSRKTKYDYIQMFALVINDLDGIVDCFGFNEISEPEFERIVAKFFSADQITEVDAEFCKYMLINAEKITRLFYDEIPYEYIAWKTIINDIPYKELNLTENAKLIGLNEFLLKQIYKTGYFDKWFFDSKSLLGDFFRNIEKNKDLNSVFEMNLDRLLNEQITESLCYRLVLTSYLLRREGHSINADIVYSLSFDSPIRNIFFENIIKKSIYEYFLNRKEQYYSTETAKSIFTRKKEEERKKIDINFVETVLKEIEEKWVENE